MLTAEQLSTYNSTGHLTVPDVLSKQDVAEALQDIELWSQEFLAELSDDQRGWFLERGGQAAGLLRKLDNPHFHRPWFRSLASRADIVEMVEQLIGSGLSAFFSQVFMKPPEGGGPKPVHQDNFYFGPSDLQSTLTVWIALDEATTENGCLFYADGSNHDPVLAHTAPEDEPFNLQIPADVMEQYTMTPAPVPSGGISFHHGNTLHQSSSNTSDRPRRAVAIHYLRNNATLTKPALKYNMDLLVKVS